MFVRILRLPRREVNGGPISFFEQKRLSLEGELHRIQYSAASSTTFYALYATVRTRAVLRIYIIQMAKKVTDCMIVCCVCSVQNI